MSHKCYADNCQRNVPNKLLMCGRHWAKVPEIIQRAVYATWNIVKGGGLSGGKHIQAVRNHLNAKNAARNSVGNLADFEAQRPLNPNGKPAHRNS